MSVQWPSGSAVDAVTGRVVVDEPERRRGSGCRAPFVHTAVYGAANVVVSRRGRASRSRTATPPSSARGSRPCRAERSSLPSTRASIATIGSGAASGRRGCGSCPCRAGCCRCSCRRTRVAARVREHRPAVDAGRVGPLADGNVNWTYGCRPVFATETGMFVAGRVRGGVGQPVIVHRPSSASPARSYLNCSDAVWPTDTDAVCDGATFSWSPTPVPSMTVTV